MTFFFATHLLHRSSSSTCSLPPSPSGPLLLALSLQLRPSITAPPSSSLLQNLPTTSKCLTLLLTSSSALHFILHGTFKPPRPHRLSQAASTLAPIPPPRRVSHHSLRYCIIPHGPASSHTALHHPTPPSIIPNDPTQSHIFLYHSTRSHIA